MMRLFFLTIFFQFISLQFCKAQFEPKIDIGSTAVLQYSNAQAGVSPLAFNSGNATFLTSWDLLFGAQINENLGLFADIQSWRSAGFFLRALSIIYNPENEKLPSLEFGKFPAPFGNFLKRRWANVNPLSNWPLIYNYRTALTRVGLPQSKSHLLKWRGRGQRVDYNVGTVGATEGLRILSRYVSLTGLQIFGGNQTFSYSIGVTNGSLSTATNVNANDGLNFIGHLGIQPTMGLEIGASFASGSYIEGEISVDNGDLANKNAEDFRQKTLGLDVAYSLGHFEFFGEGLFNRWESPFIDGNLDALAFQVELKVSFLPRYFVAGRISGISFAQIDDLDDVDEDGHLKESWDYDVNQYEIGLGYDINRNFLFKVFKVFNRTRDVPTGDPADDQIAAQLVLSF